jgi:CDGSH-type Zn-finger protein
VRENGPVAIAAEMQIEGHGPALRATLCRCGQSQNKPFCDGSHNHHGFQDEPVARELPPKKV